MTFAWLPVFAAHRCARVLRALTSGLVRYDQTVSDPWATLWDLLELLLELLDVLGVAPVWEPLPQAHRARARAPTAAKAVIHRGRGLGPGSGRTAFPFRKWALPG